jgi:crotonobetainyl-CoA:carnitine CoA-transferase CaiB-like acyl-CoA transferase
VPPYTAGESSLFFETFNRNKRSISLDLRVPEGRQVFEDLVRVSDAVYSNLRGDQPEKLRLRYEDLSHLNPRIVCCSLSGFGTTGPRRTQPGYDYVVQGLAGWMSLTGEPGGPPAKTGLSLVDLSSGYASAIALLAGLWQARRDGVGCECDISLFEAALHQLAYVGTWVASAGFVPEKTRQSAHPSIVPFQLFATSDGWIIVGCAKEKFWVRFATAIDLADLVGDTRFADLAKRGEHRDELLAILEPRMRQRRTYEWLELLTAAGVPCSAVNDVAGALEDPQFLARGGLVETEHDELGTVRQIPTPLRVGDVPPLTRRGPLRGEHTDDVLTELCGYPTEKIDALRQAGAFGGDDT